MVLKTPWARVRAMVCRSCSFCDGSGFSSKGLISNEHIMQHYPDLPSLIVAGLPRVSGSTGVRLHPYHNASAAVVSRMTETEPNVHTQRPPALRQLLILDALASHTATSGGWCVTGGGGRIRFAASKKCRGHECIGDVLCRGQIGATAPEFCLTTRHLLGGGGGGV